MVEIAGLVLGRGAGSGVVVCVTDTGFGELAREIILCLVCAVQDALLGPAQVLLYLYTTKRLCMAICILAV